MFIRPQPYTCMGIEWTVVLVVHRLKHLLLNRKRSRSDHFLGRNSVCGNACETIQHLKSRFATKFRQSCFDAKETLKTTVEIRVLPVQLLHLLFARCHLTLNHVSIATTI